MKIFENIVEFLFTKTKFNIMSSKSNFSPTQVKERKVDNLTTKNAVLQKEMTDFKYSVQSTLT